MVILIVAMVLHVSSHQEASAFAGAFAFGSAIGGCFLTQFKPAPKDVPNVLLRWWIGKLNAIGDSVAKLILVIPAGALLTWATHLDGRYWATVTIALYFLLGRAGIARPYMLPFRLGGTTGALDPKTRSNVDDYVATLIWSARKGDAQCESAVAKLRELMQRLKFDPANAATEEAQFRLHVARSRMLIAGRLHVTVIAGIACLFIWLGLTSHIMASWHGVEFKDQLAGTLGLIAGVALQFR
jgi:hypothetical protein